MKILLGLLLICSLMGCEQPREITETKKDNVIELCVSSFETGFVEGLTYALKRFIILKDCDDWEEIKKEKTEEFRRRLANNSRGGV